MIINLLETDFGTIRRGFSNLALLPLSEPVLDPLTGAEGPQGGAWAVSGAASSRIDCGVSE